MKRAWYILCGMGLVTGMALLSGCAGEMAAYDWKMPLKETAALEKYHHVLVNVQVKDGVQLPKSTLDRLGFRISACFRTVPGGKLMPVLQEGTGEGILDTQVFITRYDDGAFARSAFQEQGRMHIDGEVILSDWQTKEKLAVFGLSQAYDRAQPYSVGGLTKIDELEPQFAQAVVAGITQQAR